MKPSPIRKKSKKNFILLFLATVIFYSCDPVVNMEANIENLTTQDLIIEFISLDENLAKTLEISIDETKLFQEGFDVGNDFLEPSLIEYDSVIVKNSAGQLLKVYKPNDSGKTIYNVNEYWLSSETPKRFFRYEYEIYDEDLDRNTPSSQERTPTVKSDSTFEVLFEEGVIYAEGLSHESLNSPDYSMVPLKLDIYSPDNDNENRPLLMFIHGGGFRGGSKQQKEIVNIAHYYASRGWVFISVAYRKKGNIGTVPQEWIDNIPNFPPDEDPEQILAMYPAHRDTKAAMRWIMSKKDLLKINEEYITVGGASAGAVQAITLGISTLEDYRDEISTIQDPTLSTTNLDETYEIKTIIDFWGNKSGLDALELIYGHQRFDSNDPPMLIIHGTADETVDFSGAEDLKAIYEANGIAFEFYPLEGKGHKAWNAEVDNRRIEALAFDFIVNQQNLDVE